jgi:benzylsuccinate CoA-transferase BbsF subunit
LKTALVGIRVIDFCWVGAGALVTQALAVHGAEVVKMESSVHPDNLRLSGPFRADHQNLNGSGYFASRNSNKKSFAINMSHPRAKDLALRLAATGSVVSSNFRPGVMERWGLDYESVRAVNPSVVYLTMPMQGATGPHRDFVGFGSTIAAATGLVAPTGLPGRTPVGTGTHYPDHVPNPGHALVAVLAALLRRQRTGNGAYIELAQLESTANVLGPLLLAASLGEDALPRGNRADASVPHGCYPCAGDDVWCAISVTGDEQWRALTASLNAPWLSGDPRFTTDEGRRLNEEALDAALAEVTCQFVCADLVKLCQVAGVAAAGVASPKDLLEDPNLVERGFWQSLVHPELGAYRVGSTAFHGSDGSGRPTTRAPLLGEHTDELARDLLSLTDDEIAELRTDGVLV